MSLKRKSLKSREKKSRDKKSREKKIKGGAEQDLKIPDFEYNYLCTVKNLFNVLQCEVDYTKLPESKIITLDNKRETIDLYDTIPLIINNKTYIFDLEHQIACGAFGCVFKYSTIYENQKCFISVKYGFVDEEIEIIKLLKKLDNKEIYNVLIPAIYLENNQVKSKATINNISKNAQGKTQDKNAQGKNAKNAQGNKLNCVIMQLIEGNLSKISDYTISQDRYIVLFQILLQVTKTLEILYKNNLYYFDYKFENIFYRCKDNDNIQIIFGDLGSISIAKNLDDDESYVSTYPSYVLNDGPAKESDLIYGVGAMFMLFMDNDPKIARKFRNIIGKNYDQIFYWQNLSEYKDSSGMENSVLHLYHQAFYNVVSDYFQDIFAPTITKRPVRIVYKIRGLLRGIFVNPFFQQGAQDSFQDVKKQIQDIIDTINIYNQDPAKYLEKFNKD